jgi:hypothetical protein
MSVQIFVRLYDACNYLIINILSRKKTKKSRTKICTAVKFLYKIVQIFVRQKNQFIRFNLLIINYL